MVNDMVGDDADGDFAIEEALPAKRLSDKLAVPSSLPASGSSATAVMCGIEGYLACYRNRTPTASGAGVLSWGGSLGRGRMRVPP
jgi:hypothetical protein